MAQILTAAAFVGMYLVPDSGSDTLLDDVIDYSEQYYLRKLLGDDLYSAFISALADNPDQKWIYLRDGVTYIEIGTEENKVFQGVAMMLKFFTRAKYLEQRRFFISTNGQGTKALELGVDLNKEQFSDSQMEMINKGIDIYNEAINFIYNANNETADTYENFYNRKLIHKQPGFDLI